MITGHEVGRRVDNEEGEVREWHHRGRSYEERSKIQGRTKKIQKGESKGEWSQGLNNGVFIHLFHYFMNKEAIYESGKQDIYSNKEIHLAVCAYSSSVAFTTKEYDQNK